jgi:hypothetical protein
MFKDKKFTQRISFLRKDLLRKKFIHIENHNPKLGKIHHKCFFF